MVLVWVASMLTTEVTSKAAATNELFLPAPASDGAALPSPSQQMQASNVSGPSDASEGSSSDLLYSVRVDAVFLNGLIVYAMLITVLLVVGVVEYCTRRPADASADSDKKSGQMNAKQSSPAEWEAQNPVAAGMMGALDVKEGQTEGDEEEGLAVHSSVA
eukprot:6569111-Prymnesium_polylepis.1